MRATPTITISARMIGIFEIVKPVASLMPSAICSGMLAPAISTTTARKKKNFMYRNRPKITSVASTASRVLWLTPSVSVYSCGSFASPAATVTRPVRIRSRMRSLVRKSSPSFFSAIPIPLFLAPILGPGPPLASGNMNAHVQGFRKRIARGTRGRSAGKFHNSGGREELYFALRLRSPQGRVEAARGGRSARDGEGGFLGRRARRPLGERGLPLRQEAAARDRPARAVPDQAPRGRRDRRFGGPRQRSSVLRRHRGRAD